MGDEEVALLRLWREKRGEAEPEDLTSSLEILLALQLSFFEMSALGCGLMCPAPE